ncbi:MAG: hypothetical protein NC931_06880 [Candidatus Omnitrophica bacterium]|nr:hypothetical protein [Candidatus Omnitrophota bacterium]
MKNKTGYLLPMAIIFVLISTTLGMGILYLGGNEQIAAIKRYHKEKAFYIAEAGINRAFAYKKANESWHPETNPISFGGGNFIVTETVQGETIIFTSTGNYKGQSEKISIHTYRSSSRPGTLFNYGIFGSQAVALASNAIVDGYDSRLGPYGPSNRGNYGDTGSTGDITLYGNAHIYGTALLEDAQLRIVRGGLPPIEGGGDFNDETNYLTLSIGSTVTNYDLNHTFESPFDNLPPVNIPSDLQSMPYPVQGDPRITGNYSLYYGKLTVNNNNVVTISGGSFKFHSITMNNNSTMYITGNARIFVQYALKLYNNTRIIIQNNSEVILYLGFSGSIPPFWLTIANNSVINNTSNVPANLRIYVGSTTQHLWFANNSEAFNAVIYAPHARVIFYQNSNFYGSIVAQEIILMNNSFLHYDIALRDINFPEAPGGGSVQPGPRVIVRWTKPDWANRLQ